MEVFSSDLEPLLTSGNEFGGEERDTINTFLYFVIFD